MPFLNRSSLLSFLLFTAFPIYIWSKNQPIQIAPKAAYLTSLIIFSLVFFTPVIRAAQYQDMAAATPWQLGLGYFNYQNELKVVENNLLNLNKISPLNNLNADKLNDSRILNRQYDNADFTYTFSDLLGHSYDGYLDDESILSKNFIEDSIVVGDPYGKSLSLLRGTTHIKISQHGAH